MDFSGINLFPGLFALLVDLFIVILSLEPPALFWGDIHSFGHWGPYFWVREIFSIFPETNRPLNTQGLISRIKPDQLTNDD